MGLFGSTDLSITLSAPFSPTFQSFLVYILISCCHSHVATSWNNRSLWTANLTNLKEWRKKKHTKKKKKENSNGCRGVSTSWRSEIFITDVLVLYLRVLLGRLLLEVWGGCGDGRKLSSQDATHPPLTLLSACQTEQSFAVNLVTPNTLLSTKAASRNNITGAQWSKITPFLPF